MAMFKLTIGLTILPQRIRIAWFTGYFKTKLEKLTFNQALQFKIF